MVGFLTPYATDGISYGFGFVFCGTNLAAGIMVYLFLYESKSLALEQVDVMYSQKDLKPWNSKHWMPEGYVDRNTRDPDFWANRYEREGRGEEKGSVGRREVVKGEVGREEI